MKIKELEKAILNEEKYLNNLFYNISQVNDEVNNFEKSKSLN